MWPFKKKTTTRRQEVRKNIPPTPGAWIGNKVREILYPVTPLVDAYVTPAYIKNLDRAYDDDGGYYYGSGLGGGSYGGGN